MRNMDLPLETRFTEANTSELKFIHFTLTVSVVTSHLSVTRAAVLIGFRTGVPNMQAVVINYSFIMISTAE